MERGTDRWLETQGDNFKKALAALGAGTIFHLREQRE